MTDLRLNAWSRLKFLDPQRTLVAYRAIELALMGQDIDPKVARLRTSALKTEREARDAALFSLGMSRRLGCSVLFAPIEDADHDFIARYVIRGVQHFTPVQLKELVPEDLNQRTNLDELLSKLRSKAVVSDTTLALRLNRTSTANLEKERFAGVPFGEVWVFWASSPDSARWSLFGNMLADPMLTEYEYPE